MIEMWWPSPVILILRRLRLEKSRVQGQPGYTVKSLSAI